MLTENPSLKELDIIIFGATGAAGHQIVDYFVREIPKHYSITWGIAGRDASKLHKLSENIQCQISPLCKIDTFVVDASDPSSLVQLTQKTHILINCVGPYEVYGRSVVKACIETKTSYIDLTIEPNFIQDIYHNFDTLAKETGVFIIPACGVNEVFSDMGIHYARTELEPGQLSYAECFLNPENYGTHSVVSGGWQYLVGVGSKRKVKPRPRTPETIPIKTHHSQSINKWALPLNEIVTSLIVYRTSDLLPIKNTYFQYGNYLAVPSVFQLIYFFFFLWILALFCKFELTRKLLSSLKKSTSSLLDPTPNTEPPVTPSLYEENGFFLVPNQSPRKKRIQLVVVATGEVSPYIATSFSENTLRRVVIKVSGPNNQSHIQTSALTVSRCALCLLLNMHRLPLTGGVVTTALALGNYFVEDLENAGVVFSVRATHTVLGSEETDIVENEETSNWSNLLYMFDDKID